MKSFKDSFSIFIPVDVVKSINSDDDTPWIFEGIASTPDSDLFDEVVYPESFHNSIEFFKSNGKIFFNHDYAKENEDWLNKFGFSKDEILSLKTPLGKPIDAEVRSDGLYIKAMLNKQHPMARKMWEEFLHNPDPEFQSQIGLSIGAKYLGEPRRQYDVKKGKYVTYLPDLLLYEVSMTPEPVNPHTKTWESVLKSMISVDKKVTKQFHTIVPDETIYDKERNRLIIKSTVHGGDDITHIFESYIDLKEDITSAMADTLKAAPEEKEKKAPVDIDASPDEPDKNPEPGLSEEAVDQGIEVSREGTDADDDTQGTQIAPDGVAPQTPDAGLPETESGMTDLGAAKEEEELAPNPADEGAGGVLDTLVGDEDGGEEEEGGEDAAIEMVLDKLDTILDLFQTIADSLHTSGGEEAPMADQVTHSAPSVAISSKSIDMEELKEVLKDTFSQDKVVTLSDESTLQFGEAIKSVFDGFEDRIVEKVVNKLYNETTVAKSVAVVNRREAAIIHPGAAVNGDSGDTVPAIVNKSVSIQEDNNDTLSLSEVDTLKSLVSSYRDIIGHTASHSQQRGKVVEQAEKVLGIESRVFNHYVSLADKGKF